MHLLEQIRHWIRSSLPFNLFSTMGGEDPGTFADDIDQDQTAQNVQSDLDLCRPLVQD